MPEITPLECVYLRSYELELQIDTESGLLQAIMITLSREDEDTEVAAVQDDAVSANRSIPSTWSRADTRARSLSLRVLTPASNFAAPLDDAMI